MNNQDFSGSAKITNEGIKKHFKKYEPIDVLFEYIWNGLDANSNEIQVIIEKNDLDEYVRVGVLDDGEGIDFQHLDLSFGRFNDSTKKNDDNKHGTNGKGRLSFYRLCSDITWFSKNSDGNVKIKIRSSNIKDYKASSIPTTEQHGLLKNLDSGTYVVLEDFYKYLPSEKDIQSKCSIEFGWYLALNKSKRILIDGDPVIVPVHESFSSSLTIDENDFSVTVIQWKDKPSSEKSYNYLITSKNEVVNKKLSNFNRKISFYTSAYVYSDWVDLFDSSSMKLDNSIPSEDTPTYRKLQKELDNYQRDIYDSFLKEYVDDQIRIFDEEGYFPDYSSLDPSYADWRKKNTTSTIRDIYLSDPSIFSNLKPKPTKIIIRLIDKVLVSNENDDFLEILEGVIDLKPKETSMLAKQIKRSSVDNIVRTIEVIQKRESVISKLSEIMINRYKEIRETPDLQNIIESNTWLFGPQYTTIGAEEDDFHKTAQELHKTIPNISKIDNDDLDEIDLQDGLDIDGVRRQVDLFLARKVLSFDSEGKQYYRCIIIEIKRPGVSLNIKHLRQLDDYADILRKQTSFNSALLKFELVLVGRKISKDDYGITDRLSSLKTNGEPGLVTYTEKVKSYVKNWFTIFDEFKISNEYLLNNLKTKREYMESEPTEDLVKDLQEVSN